MRITKVFTNNVFGTHNYVLILKQKEIEDSTLTYHITNQIHILDTNGPNIEKLIYLLEIEQKRKNKRTISVTIPTHYKKSIRCFYNQGYTLQEVEYNYQNMKLSKELKTNT